MTFPRVSTAILLALSACTATSGLENSTIDLGQIETDSSGKCFAKDTSPAVIETITTQVVARPAELDADGNEITPAIFDERTVPRMISERQELRFETICPPDYTSEFVSTVQRALIVRGFYKGAVNGLLDASTSDAIKRFQSGLGLNTPFLAVETARKLGAIALDRDTLQ